MVDKSSKDLLKSKSQARVRMRRSAVRRRLRDDDFSRFRWLAVVVLIASIAIVFWRRENWQDYLHAWWFVLAYLSLIPVVYYVSWPGKRRTLPLMSCYSAIIGIAYGWTNLAGLVPGKEQFDMESLHLAIIIGFSSLLITGLVYGLLHRRDFVSMPRNQVVKMASIREIKPLHLYSLCILLTLLYPLAGRFGLGQVFGALRLLAFTIVAYQVCLMGVRARFFGVCILVAYLVGVVLTSLLASVLTCSLLWILLPLGRSPAVRRRFLTRWIFAAVALGATLFTQFYMFKVEYRTATWYANEGELSFFEKIRVLESIVERGERETSFGLRIESSFDAIAHRLGHHHTLAHVIELTPSEIPYLEGESYKPILTKWIPRVLWSGKPLENFGNTWAQRYRLLDPGNETTSYNCPPIVEAWINFGWAGILGFSFMIGLLFYGLDKLWEGAGFGWLASAAIFSVAAGFIIAGSNFSLMAGQVMVGGIVVSVALFSLGLIKFRRNG